MVLTKAVAAGLTGVTGLVLGLTLGVTGASAVAAHHNQDQRMSHSASQGQQNNKGNQKHFTGSQQGEQRHKRQAPNGDGSQRTQPQSDGANQQSGTPNTNPAPTGK